MLYEFLTVNRTELIRRCRGKEAARADASRNPEVTDHGVPVFLKQLIDTLRHEHLSLARNFGKPEPVACPQSIGSAAALHGAALLRQGYSVDEVVRDYGDVCQAVTEMAIEQKLQIGADEFRTLNRCLDDAIAGAVTAYAAELEASAEGHAEAVKHELESISEEQQRLIESAIHAFSAVRTGSIGLSGATGTVLMHTLLELRGLAKRVAMAPAKPVTQAG